MSEDGPANDQPVLPQDRAAGPLSFRRQMGGPLWLAAMLVSMIGWAAAGLCNYDPVAGILCSGFLLSLAIGIWVSTHPDCTYRRWRLIPPALPFLLFGALLVHLLTRPPGDPSRDESLVFLWAGWVPSAYWLTYTLRKCWYRKRSPISGHEYS